MSEAQKHDYATAPHGSFDLPAELLPDADLRARLTRPAVGATRDEADQLIAKLPASVIKSESDELLAQRVKDYRRDGDVFDPSVHSVRDVLGFVGDDTDKARTVLAAETSDGGKNRSSLVDKLEKLIEPEQVNTPPTVVSAPSDDADTGGGPVGDGSNA